MFTGLIERTAKIVSKASSVLSIDVGSDFNASIGDSISINGVCLTVTKINNSILSFDVSHESLKVTNLYNLAVGNQVNIERSMPSEGRFHGHFVMGHVDTTGRVTSVIRKDNAVDLVVSFSGDSTSHLLTGKGSIAVNGVSLTVSEPTNENSFRLTLIPHTLKVTNLLDLKVGDVVNIEFDILAKYVESMIKTMRSSGEGIDEAKLRSLGYV